MTKTAEATPKKSNGSPKSSSNGSSKPATNGTAVNEVKAIVPIVKQETKPEPPKEMTLQEKINRVETLQLIVDKRSKLVQTRSELEKFQVASNDFNCSLRLNDSDGNVFTSSFTPGIKKVIDFLKTSFDSSIQDVEKQIKF